MPCSRPPKRRPQPAEVRLHTHIHTQDETLKRFPLPSNITIRSLADSHHLYYTYTVQSTVVIMHQFALQNTMSNTLISRLTPPYGREAAIVMSISVCLSLSVRENIPGTSRPNVIKFSVHVARSSSGDVAISFRFCG